MSPPATRSPSSNNGSVVRFNSRSPTLSAPLTPLYRQPDDATLSHYTASSRAMEMRLLHHYTALTAKTLAATNNALTESAWQIYVPHLAFSNPCLMDALLAVSALHMRVFTPADSSLIRMFHGYMASSLSQYTQTLASGVNDTNAEALFTTSALIAFQASASRRFMNDPAVDNEPYTLPTQWFHSFQGVKTVVLTSWRWLRSSPHVRPIIAAQPALSKDVFAVAPEPFSHLLDDLPAQLANLSNSEAAEIRQAYEHSIAYLNWAHAKPEKPRILGFPATVSRRFIQLIDERDPRALVIIASFFAMTRRVDDAWWLEGVARKEVSGIMGLLDERWWPKMEWAVRIANHDGPITDEIWGPGRPSDRLGDEMMFLSDGGGAFDSEMGFGAGTVQQMNGGHIDLLGQIGDAQQIMEVACGRLGGSGMVVSTTLKINEEVSMVDLLD